MSSTDFRHRCTTAECPYLGQLTDNLSCGCHRKEAEIMRAELTRLAVPRPIAEYHEDMGDVLWWKFPIVEPPYVGSPNSLDFTVEAELLLRKDRKQHKREVRMMVGGFPGYHTHFTLIPTPKEPSQ